MGHSGQGLDEWAAVEIERIDNGARIMLEEVESRILQDLAAQLLNITTPDSLEYGSDPIAQMVGIDANVVKPTDPVLSRLYPDAYPDDPEASLEFRRYTERSLRDSGVQRTERVLQMMSDGLDLQLVDERWSDMVGFLNDLRLSLGTRLEITQSLESQEIDDGDPRSALFELYGWLTWVQEMLIEKGYPHVD